MLGFDDNEINRTRKTYFNLLKVPYAFDLEINMLLKLVFLSFTDKL